MEKGYYQIQGWLLRRALKVAIHNKNGKGLLHSIGEGTAELTFVVAIHNKNGKGLLLVTTKYVTAQFKSQSTIKMEKGYYNVTFNKQQRKSKCRNPQ